MEPFVVGSRFVLGALFMVAALAKFRRMSEFAGAVQAYRLLPPQLGPVVARVIPLLEFAIGIGLLLGLSIRVAAWGASGLLAILALAMAVNLLRGRRIDCGCLGCLLYTSPSPRDS